MRPALVVLLAAAGCSSPTSTVVSCVSDLDCRVEAACVAGRCEAIPDSGDAADAGPPDASFGTLVISVDDRAQCELAPNSGCGAEGCYVTYEGVGCAPAGTVPVGSHCVDFTDCVAGAGCVDRGVCLAFCRMSERADCAGACEPSERVRMPRGMGLCN